MSLRWPAPGNCQREAWRFNSAKRISEAATFADLPGGHSEGYDDSHKQVFKHFYARVADPSVRINYPTFEDGLHGMILLEAVAKSAQKRAWVDVQ